MFMGYWITSGLSIKKMKIILHLLFKEKRYENERNNCIETTKAD